jgi:hypothetical protein
VRVVLLVAPARPGARDQAAATAERCPHPAPLPQAITGGLLPPAFDFSPPKTPAGWTYSVFALLYVATAAGCYAPEALFQV